MTDSSDRFRTCFFCSKSIEGKKSLEHIIPNSLLGKLGIKESQLNGDKSFEYSRIKVPAHKSCNSEFGSRFETKILEILEDPGQLYADIIAEEDIIHSQYPPNESPIFLFSTWMAKIYYGLFYHDYLKIGDSAHMTAAKDIIESENFNLVRKGYENGQGFLLPSSLYVLKTHDTQFDLRTFIVPSTICIKIGGYAFVLCIADGFLTKNYMNKSTLSKFRKYITSEEETNQDFPSHLFFISELMALRINIPKSPSFSFTDDTMINTSFNTFVQNPSEYYKINPDRVAADRQNIFNQLINA